MSASWKAVPFIIPFTSLYFSNEFSLTRVHQPSFYSCQLPCQHIYGMWEETTGLLLNHIVIGLLRGCCCNCWRWRILTRTSFWKRSRLLFSFSMRFSQTFVSEHTGKTWPPTEIHCFQLFPSASPSSLSPSHSAAVPVLYSFHWSCCTLLMGWHRNQISTPTTHLLPVTPL